MVCGANETNLLVNKRARPLASLWKNKPHEISDGRGRLTYCDKKRYVLLNKVAKTLMRGKGMEEGGQTNWVKRTKLIDYRKGWRVNMEVGKHRRWFLGGSPGLYKVTRCAVRSKDLQREGGGWVMKS